MLVEIAILILPVFLIILFGFLSRQLKILIDKDFDSLVNFCQNIAIPILLFYNVATLNLNVAFELGILFPFYTSLIACFFIGFFSTKYLFYQETENAIAFGFCAMFSNGVLLGLPISELAYGKDSLSTNYAIIVGHAPICYLLGIIFMEVAKARKISFNTALLKSIKSIVSNNLSIGIFMGLIVNLVDIQLPLVITDALNLFVVSAIPLALFSLGGVLYRYKISQNLKISIFLIFTSVIVHPLMVFSLSTYFHSTDKTILINGVLMAAMAPGLNSYFFANMYNSGKEIVASTIFLGTIITIFSATAWIYILN
tara:strand:- start:45 stop:980 length:936 start_codon:yes stop_codon:yes gene_type:complete